MCCLSKEQRSTDTSRVAKQGSTVSGLSNLLNVTLTIRKICVQLNMQFFMDDPIYWAPASTTAELYAQLAKKKYRELPRDQIQ